MFDFLAGLALGTIIGAAVTIFCLWVIGKAIEFGETVR